MTPQNDPLLMTDNQYATQAVVGPVSLFETLAAIERLLRAAQRKKSAALAADMEADESIVALQSARAGYIRELLISYGRDPV